MGIILLIIGILGILFKCKQNRDRKKYEDSKEYNPMADDYFNRD